MKRFAVVGLVFMVAVSGAAEAGISHSDDQQLESGTTSQGSGTVTSSTYHHQLSISDPVGGARLTSTRFRLVPGVLGSSLSALASAPTTELDLTVLYAKEDLIGGPIPAQTWQRDHDPVFLWEQPQTGADVAGYSYAIDSMPDEVIDTIATSFNVAASSLKALADGQHTFMVKAVNSAGSAGAPATFDLWVDTLAPAIVGYAPSPGALLNAMTTSVTATITDAASGVAPASVRWLLNGMPLSAQFDQTTNTVTSTGVAWHEGANSLELRVADQAGNTQTPLIWSVMVDTRAPTGTVVMNSGADRTTSIFVTLSLDASDATSGISRMLVSNTADRGYVEEPFVAIRELWKLTALRGVQAVYVKFVDQAGNVSAPVSDAIELALLSPETMIVSGPAGFSHEPQVTFEFSCPEDGCVYAYAFDDGDWSDWGPATTAVISGLAQGNHYFRVKAAKDMNGIPGIQPDEADPSPAERTWVMGVNAPMLTVPKGPPIKAWRIE